MTQVNLLPPELRQRELVRRQTTLVALAGVAALVLLGIFFFFQTVSLSAAKGDLDQRLAANAQLSQQIGELQPYADLQQQLEAKKQLKDTLLLNEVSWAGVLLDISRVIPDPAYLVSLTGSITAPTGTVVGTAAPTTGPSNLIGSMSFSGVADGTPTISGWLSRLEKVSGWVNPWVNSAQESGADTGIYQFNSGVDLTTEAATDRGRGIHR